MEKASRRPSIASRIDCWRTRTLPNGGRYFETSEWFFVACRSIGRLNFFMVQVYTFICIPYLNQVCVLPQFLFFSHICVDPPSSIESDPWLVKVLVSEIGRRPDLQGIARVAFGNTYYFDYLQIQLIGSWNTAFPPTRHWFSSAFFEESIQVQILPGTRRITWEVSWSRCPLFQIPERWCDWNRSFH